MSNQLSQSIQNILLTNFSIFSPNFFIFDTFPNFNLASYNTLLMKIIVSLECQQKLVSHVSHSIFEHNRNSISSLEIKFNIVSPICNIKRQKYAFAGGWNIVGFSQRFGCLTDYINYCLIVNSLSGDVIIFVNCDRIKRYSDRFYTQI